MAVAVVGIARLDRGSALQKFEATACQREPSLVRAEKGEWCGARFKANGGGADDGNYSIFEWTEQL